MRFTTSRLGAAALAVALAASGSAQTIAPPVSTKSASAPDDATVLSPFEVNSGDDKGYQAGNTTSGSRLNASLKDTAASVSVFTPEFLSDIAANNISEMLAYATNVESEFEDSNGGFNNPTSRASDGTTSDFRVRGIQGSFAVDLLESAVPQDNYNVERVELASGPNSVLFGLGSAGGLVTLSTKRANVQRNRVVFKTQLGEWDQQRFEADLNYVLIPKKLAVRAQGLNSSREGWRHWDFEDQRRGTAAITFKPWTNTTLRASGERGQFSRHATWPWNGGDQITLWRAQGRVIKDTFVTATDTPLGLASYGTNNRFTVYENDGNTLYNLRNELQSVGQTAAAGATLLKPADMPYAYSFNGPGATFNQSFTNYQVAAEHRVSRGFTVEAAYLHTDSYASMMSWAVPGNMIDLRADPNLTTPDPRDPTRTIANAHAGQFYMDGNWRPDTTKFANNVYRATAAAEHDFGKWGLHRLTGLLETGKLVRNRRSLVDILVDDNNVPLANATPENAQNQLLRRHYVTLGDYTTYYQGNPQLAIPVLPVAVTTGTTTTIKNAHLADVATSGASNTDSIKQTDTMMLAMQNYWFRKRLVTTFGYRVDSIVFKDGITARLAATDPRVVAKQRVSGDFEPTGNYNRYAYKPRTHTEGAVYHLNSRFSLFYNQSSNVGSPRFDRTVLPGVLPPPTDGKGKDGGIMIDFKGDGRYYVRATIYDTKFMRDTPIIPGGVGGGNFVTTAESTILDHLQSRGRITQAERDAHYLFFTAFMVDVISSGEELEFVANPTKNWTVRLTYSHSERGRDNYFNEREPYLTDFKTYVKSKDDGAVIASTGRTVQQEIETLEQTIQDNQESQEQSYGARPHKGNVTSRYSFSQGRLKGLFIGGAYRYQGANYVQQDQRAGSPTEGKVFKGQAIGAADFFAGYSARVPWLKAKATFQLNLKNTFNESLVTIGRYNSDFSGARRVYLQEPRSWRFTTTLEF